MIPQLAAILSSGGLSARREAVETLFDCAEEGADLTAALAALGGALSDTDESIRECAGEILAYLARKGEAMGAAVPGLVLALGDADLALVAGESLRERLVSEERAEILSALRPGLDGAPLQARNAAGLLVRGWLLVDDQASVAELLVREQAVIRQGACEAAVIAAREGRDISGLVASLTACLMARPRGVARRAGWLLSRADPQQVPVLLTHSRSEVRLGGLASLAEDCDSGHMPTAWLSVVAGCLKDVVAECRQKAAYVLAALAEVGTDLASVCPALGAALLDPAPAVRSEAALALLWMARSGQDISTAGIPALLTSAGGSLRRTAAMAWGRHLLNTGEADGLEALLTGKDRHVRFGAVWGVTERHLARHDVGALLVLLQRGDRLIGEAVVSTMRQFREEGRDVSAGLTAIHLLQQGGLMESARAQGLFAEFLR